MLLHVRERAEAGPSELDVDRAASRIFHQYRRQSRRATCAAGRFVG
jgi:hypothetical protein